MKSAVHALKELMAKMGRARPEYINLATVGPGFNGSFKYKGSTKRQANRKVASKMLVVLTKQDVPVPPLFGVKIQQEAPTPPVPTNDYVLSSQLRQEQELLPPQLEEVSAVQPPYNVGGHERIARSPIKRNTTELSLTQLYVCVDGRLEQAETNNLQKVLPNVHEWQRQSIRKPEIIMHEIDCANNPRLVALLNDYKNTQANAREYFRRMFSDSTT